MRSELVLLTPADATLPADGAILVVHREVKTTGNSDGDPPSWTIKDRKGATVVCTVEDIGSGVERWVPKTAADRDLVIVDDNGKKVAALHQTKARSTAALESPAVTSFKSTVTLDDAKKSPGRIGGATKLELSKDAPAGTRYLTIAITGDTPRVHSAITPKNAQQHIFESVSYSGKSCSHSGPGPLLVGQQVALAWVDDLGRRSAATTVNVAKQPGPKR